MAVRPHSPIALCRRTKLLPPAVDRKKCALMRREWELEDPADSGTLDNDEVQLLVEQGRGDPAQHRAPASTRRPNAGRSRQSDRGRDVDPPIPIAFLSPPHV